MADNHNKPPALNELGDNFCEWQTRFKFFLLAQGKSDALDEDSVPATASSSKVLGWNGQSVPAAFLLDIHACKNAKEAWERLEQLFKETNQADIDALETKYNDLALQPKESIPEFISRGQGLHNRLKSAGITMSEDQLIRRLLKGLPKPYETYRTMALHSTTGLPKLQEVKSSLMALEADCNRQRSQEEIALLAHQRNNPFKKEENKPRDIKRPFDKTKARCNYCKEKGHFKADWRSKKQTTVTLSTTEAEYVAGAAATREALWFRQLAHTLDIPLSSCNVYADNQAMIKLTKNPILSPRSKHIDIMHHFLRERVARGEVSFTYVPTDKMLADIFTKALSKQKHQECCKALGLR